MANRHGSAYLRRKRLIICGMILVGMVIGLSLQAYRPVILFRVNGTSMTPTLEDGEYHIAVKVDGDDLDVGDIVIMSSDLASGTIVKRVAALAGDFIQIENGSVKVNGEMYPFRNSEKGELYESAGERVVSGEVYLLGDNPYDSLDSRYYGTVELQGNIYRMVI